MLADGVPQTEGISLKGDARTFGTRCGAALAARGMPPVRLVLTSPPYLGVLRYGQYNWLRMWLVGSDAEDVDLSLDVHRPSGYADFMRDTLVDLRQVLARDAVVVLVIGDVQVVRGRPVRGPSLPELVWFEAASPAGYRLVGAFADTAGQSRRVSRMWGDRAGAATEETRCSSWHPRWTASGVQRRVFACPSPGQLGRASRTVLAPAWRNSVIDDTRVTEESPLNR